MNKLRCSRSLIEQSLDGGKLQFNVEQFLSNSFLNSTKIYAEIHPSHVAEADPIHLINNVP